MAQGKSDSSDSISKMFAGKVVLAPMVRVSTHPFRLMALKYGADFVFCEEIIDHKLIRCERVENKSLNTIDFVAPDRTIVFRTSHEEKNKVILQLGTANAQRALMAAKVVQNDVAGIDVNMGCPKDYSTKGGMGAALLSKPDVIRDILTTLVQNISIPVTCKIRVLPSLEETLNLVKMIEDCGVVALTVHGRLKTDRTSNPCRQDYIQKIANTLSIPILANGGSKEIIRLHDDIEYFRMQTNASGVMVARAAMWNPTVFSPDHQNRTELENAREYVTISLKYDHNFVGVKYCVLRMLMSHTGSEFHEKLSESIDMKEFCKHFDLADEYEQAIQSRIKLQTEIAQQETVKRSLESNGDTRDDDNSNAPICKKGKIDFEKLLPASYGDKNIEITEDSVEFNRHDYVDIQDLPKQRLHFKCDKAKLKPTYRVCEFRDARLFYGSVELENSVYINTCGCKQRRFAEHSAALV